MKKKKTLTKRHRAIASMPLLMLLFLIEEKVLTKFLNNCESCMFESDIDYILYKKRCGNEITLKDYFCWGDTPESGKYWLDISRKYALYLYCRDSHLWKRH